jgi:hypothetical protein
MYCDKHKEEGKKVTPMGLSEKELRRVLDIIRTVECPECRKELINR